MSRVSNRHACIQATLLAAAERHRAHDLAAARDLYREVLRIDPCQPDAIHLLGMTLAALGNRLKGEDLVRRSIELRADRADFLSNLGNLMNRSDRKAAAVEAYQAAIALDPAFADAQANLAGVLAALQRYDEAEAMARSALALSADHPTALANLAGALIGHRQFAKAEDPLRRALMLSPSSYEVWYNYGHLLMATGRTGESEDAFRRALALEPDALEAVRWLGYACMRNRKGEEAEEHLQRFLKARPTPSNAHSMLGHLFVQRGMIDEGLALLRKGVDRQDAQAAEHSTLVFDMNYDPSADPVCLRVEHERWARRFALPLTLRGSCASTPKNPHRRLRVGFISPDFRAHSVSYFFLPVLEQLDRAQLDVYCYAYVAIPDSVTERLRRAADHWRDIFGSSDEEVVQRIRDDQIDILVDLAGHTSDSRLLVLAHRPAPVQASYLGYPNTTGMAAVDWRIVDVTTDPPQADLHAVERLLRLDRCFLAYDPMEYPEVVDPPCLTNGFMTFGSFNNVAKMNGRVLDTWAQILQAVPDSRLVLKHDLSHDLVVQNRLSAAFDSLGIDPARVELLSRTHSRIDHLAAYGKVDVALDTFPYGGTTTTCEALWMGVPVVTLAGTSHASRVGASLLGTIGLSSCVATMTDDYVTTARELAQASELLAVLRRMMRAELMSSMLMDHVGLGRAMTAGLRRMWEDHCSTSA